MAEEKIQLNIRMSTGDKFSIDLHESMSLSETSVLRVKDIIAQVKAELPANCQRLIYKGRILENDRTLSDYGVVNKATLHLVKGKPRASGPGNRASPAATRAPPSPAAAAPSPSANNGFPPNPFAAGGMPMPSEQQMNDMMNSPIMEQMMNNPDMMQMIMQSNPQMQELMRNNPQLREVMNNPDVMRQSLQMMRDPSARQNLMRQQDLALSQIENMPGGFAALSSMYRDVQEPMMDAMASGGNQDTPTPTNSSSANSAGASGAAMPNPWGAPAPASTTAASPRNTSTPANPFGAANPFAAAPAGGAAANPWGAIPGMPSPGQMPNPDQMEATINMLESNPALQQMMDNMLQQNPDMIRNMMQSDPRMQQMRATNPQMAAMMDDPNFLRNMMNPQAMRSMMQLQRAFGGAMPGGGMPGMSPQPPAPTANPWGAPAPAAAAAANPWGAGASATPPPLFPGGMDFSNLLNQMQSTNIGAGAAAPPSNVHPADRYRSQLASLRDMGFDDEILCLRALERYHGNLNRAVDGLLMGEVSHDGGSTAAPATAPVPPPATESTESEADNATPKDASEKKND